MSTGHQLNMDMNQVHLDCLREIYSFLELSDICSISQTSKRFDSVGDAVISTLEVIAWPEDKISQKVLESMMSSGKMVKLRRITRIYARRLQRLCKQYPTSCPRFETLGARRAHELLRQLSDSMYIHKKHAWFSEPFEADIMKIAHSDSQSILECIKKLPSLETLSLVVNLETLNLVLPDIIDKLSKTLTRFSYNTNTPYVTAITPLSTQNLRLLSYTNLQIIQINFVDHIVPNLPASLKLFIIDMYDVQCHLENTLDKMSSVLNRSYAIEIVHRNYIKFSLFHELSVPEKLTVRFSIKVLNPLNFATNVLDWLLYSSKQHPLNSLKSLRLDPHYGPSNTEAPPIHQCFPNLERLSHYGSNVEHISDLANLKELTIESAFTDQLVGEFSVEKLTVVDGRISPSELESLLQDCQWPNLTDISFQLEDIGPNALFSLSKVIDKHPNLKNVEIQNFDELFSSMISMSDRSVSILGVGRLNREIHNLMFKS
eukprot:748168_1